MNTNYDKAAYKESAQKRLEWIKALAEVSKNPEMKLATTVRAQAGYWHPSSRITLEEYEKLLNPSAFIPDYYTVRCWQVVFEQDAPWDHPVYGVKVLAKKIVEALKSLGMPHIIFDSGGKGIHSYVFYKPPENKTLLEQACAKGIMPKDLRLLVFKLVCDKAGIPEEHRGVGKPQDIACINFSDDSGMGKLIRCPGGRKIDKETGELIGYKTFIDKIPEQKTLVKKFTDVVYPSKNDIKIWTLPEIIFSKFIENFKPPREGVQNSLKEYKGMLINAPCARSLLLNGAPPSTDNSLIGHRSFGAKALAVFCVGDGLDYYEAGDVLKSYYSRCDPTDFDIGEVMAWRNWAYQKVLQNPEKYVHCGHMRAIGLCDKEHCEYFKKIKEKWVEEKRKEARKKRRQKGMPQQLRPYAQPPERRTRGSRKREDREWREKIIGETHG